jgi:hypothetical protein
MAENSKEAGQIKRSQDYKLGFSAFHPRSKKGKVK